MKAEISDSNNDVIITMSPKEVNEFLLAVKGLNKLGFVITSEHFPVVEHLADTIFESVLGRSFEY